MVVRRLAVVMVALLLAACGERLVRPGAATAAGAFRVETSLAWTRLPAAAGELWTIDGQTLNQLHFIAAIAAGEHVLTRQRRDARAPDGPYYRPGLDAPALQQLVVDAVIAQGAIGVQATGLRPAGDHAVRFELALASAWGLRYRGRAWLAERDARLYLMLYLAPEEHYYARDAGAIDALFASARLAP